MRLGEGVRERGQGSMTPDPLPRITFFNTPLSQGLGLLNEHDGDIILDFIKEPAFLTDETVPRLI
jgi:hypothetical protein